MSSYVDMSLEDIIQKKKKEKPRIKKPINKGLLNSNPTNRKMQNQKFPITDARYKIISKKRTQIVDAREKLEDLAKQRDARFKLEELRKMRGITQIPSRNIKKQGKFNNEGKINRPVISQDRRVGRDRVFVDPSRQVVSQPLNTSKFGMRRQLSTKRFLENRAIGSKHLDRMPRPKPILRTVENDIEIIDDPMGEDFEPIHISSDRKASLQLKIIAHNSDGRASRSSVIQRSAIITEKEKSPPRPPSILKKRPMAALRSEKRAEKSETPPLEYRIIVSNLGSTVTGGDIEELFGDVGGMIESRLVRPGTAEVIYKTQEDAQKAVDLYHNRQLDGQPMNCLLVTPRAPTVIPRSSSGSKPALYSTNSNVEPDISTFHKVLFSNL